MTEERKRRWYELHFRTMAVLFLSGVLVFWENAQPYAYTFSNGSIMGERATTQQGIGYGWPCNMSPKSTFIMTLPDFDAIIINLVVALCIFAAACFLCEWFIRHREAKAAAKGAQAPDKAE